MIQQNAPSTNTLSYETNQFLGWRSTDVDNCHQVCSQHNHCIHSESLYVRKRNRLPEDLFCPYDEKRQKAPCKYVQELQEWLRGSHAIVRDNLTGTQIPSIQRFHYWNNQDNGPWKRKPDCYAPDVCQWRKIPPLPLCDFKAKNIAQRNRSQRSDCYCPSKRMDGGR